MRRRPWDPEGAAANRLQQILGGTVVPRDGHDPVHRDNLHDFDLVLDDGRVIAVEVTQAARPEVQQQLSLASKLDWTFPDLNSSWYVSLVEGAPRLSELHRSIVRLLNNLEKLGVSRYRTTDTTVREALHKEIKRLGIRQIAAMPEILDHTVLVSTSPSQPGYGASGPANIVADHAAREDNVVKLGLSREASERHLFIWVLTDHFGAIAAMSEPYLPSESPELPSEIDVVWLATGFDPPLSGAMTGVDGVQPLEVASSHG